MTSFTVEPAGAGIGLAISLLIAVLALGLVALFVWSIAWVWRDATRRGQPGFIVAVLLAFLCWPLGLFVWSAARPQNPGEPLRTGGRALVWAVVAAVANIIVLAILLFLLVAM